MPWILSFLALALAGIGFDYDIARTISLSAGEVQLFSMGAAFGLAFGFVIHLAPPRA